MSAYRVPVTVSRILIVEDDPALRVLMLRTLRENGYEATGVGDGVEMGRSLEAGSFDLVLLDIMLPGGNGLDLCARCAPGAPYPSSSSARAARRWTGCWGSRWAPTTTSANPSGRRSCWHGSAPCCGAGRSRPMPGHRGATGRVSPVGRWTSGAASCSRRLGPGWTCRAPSTTCSWASSTHPQRVIGRERLLELSRSRLGDVTDRSIDVLVSRLRRKLQQDDVAAPMIRTVRGIGYSFAVPVERD